MNATIVKWTPGRPEAMVPGMVVRLSDRTVKLIGHYMSGDLYAPILADTIEHAQLIQGYELDWLKDMGLPAKAVIA